MEESSQAIIFYLCTLLSDQSIIKSSQERKTVEEKRERVREGRRKRGGIDTVEKPQAMRAYWGKIGEKVDEKERQQEQKKRKKERRGTVWTHAMLSGRL